MFNVLAKFLADFFSNIATKWLEMRESRKRGEAEANNAAHEENAKRKELADEIMAKPVKTGSDTTPVCRLSGAVHLTALKRLAWRGACT